MKIYDVIIIGSGPSGIFAAANISRNKKILLLEKNKIIGQKFLMSGSGRCNITNNENINNFSKRYGDNGNFLKFAFNEFNNIDTINYFKKRGLNMDIMENGKVFPNTQKSIDPLNILINECKKIEIHLNEKVLKLEKFQELYEINTNKCIYKSKSVIIATGGESYKITGSTGDGYTFAKKLSHTIIKTRPALSPIIIKNYNFKENSGMSFKNITFDLYRNEKKIFSKFGDLLFTHFGLSGPVILDNSRYFKVGDILKICFIDKKRDVITKEILAYTEVNGSKTVKYYLKTLNLYDNLIKILLDKNNIPLDLTLANLNKVSRKNLISDLVEYNFIIDKIGDFDVAMATAGGIDLKEINPKTMESKLHKNLYFIGEILDIDGNTGGYNIQAAFSMAYLAAKHISSI